MGINFYWEENLGFWLVLGVREGFVLKYREGFFLERKVFVRDKIEVGVFFLFVFFVYLIVVWVEYLLCI